MDPFNSSFADLLKRDRRYKAEAYTFVFEVLDYAQKVLHLGKMEKNEPLPQEVLAAHDEWQTREERGDMVPGHHITGQDLCGAAREYALLQYGRLAKMVLDSMGIRKTDDIGEIVYNLIDIGLMRKTTQDRREDFDNVFDFEAAFGEEYHIQQR